jgi:glutamate-ammonia-ligase adenylyltransferase
MQIPPEQHPEQLARRRWTELLEAAADAGTDLPVATLEAQALRVFEASEFVALACTRHPAMFRDLVAAGDLARPYAAGDLRARLTAALEGVADEPALHAALRRFRRAQMVRICWRDLTRAALLAEILEDLTELADACIDGALERLHAWAMAQYGTPRDAEGRPQRLVVIGMGKLGARELNLSSDIDLIYAYPAAGETDGRRALANEEFFARLGQRLTRALDATTADGFVFRVDLRLRPFGDSGPLVVSFDAFEDYCQAQAREWERYAMIKARVVAGDHDAGAQLTAMLRPFVYRRYLDFGAIESLRDMKRLISQELHRKGMDANVKLGPGGIREIEFIGQAFQLIRGGRDADLRIRPILPVLEQIATKGLLPEFVVRELTEGYAFLRLVENRIQAWRDEQTHLLPADPAGRLRLARAMGFDDWKSFSSALDRHRRRVQGHFDSVFAAPHTEEGPDELPLATLWRRPAGEDEARHVLAAAGFDDPAAAQARLDAFRDSPAVRVLGPRGRERMDQLVPLLLEAVASSGQPTLVLDRTLRLLDAIARRTAYLALLVENPLALSQLVRLTGGSAWIASELATHPVLLDELLDPRRLYTPLRLAELRAEVGEQLASVDPDDDEQQMERLRQFARSNRLRVAAADLAGAIPLMVVSDYLTWVAEAVTAEVLEDAWRYLVKRHGRPTEILGEDKGFAVIAYGKLGGLELGYGSDLDLVFLHGNRSASGMTDGARPIANDLFYARLGQRMIHLYTARTASGVLYEVDMRLRPNGNAGLLVSSLGAFETYQKNEAWTWEHQALLRARPIAGDAQVAGRFESIRREVLGRVRDAERLRAEVREMREKMRATLDRSGNGRFDVKQGLGGVADIEFMVQYLALRWAHQHSALLDWTDNIRQLETLARLGLLEGDTAKRLMDAYRSFRAVIHRSALQEEPALAPGGVLAPERQLVQGLWRTVMEA